jgi:hypothetical protein
MVSPLEGEWRTDPITPREVEATLRRRGLSRWIADFRPESPIQRTTVLVLDLHDGEWDLYGKVGSRPREEIDYDAEFVVQGERVDKEHATGTTTYQWSVEGDTLGFQWVRSTEPAYRGIPDQVFSTALYETSQFRREP